MIRQEHSNQVAILRLNRGVTNALNLEIISQLAENLQTARDSPEISSIVLGSANEKFFSIGFDIPELLGLSRKDFTAFYQTFNRTCIDLFTLPKPVIAAVTGHAIAGGCILALCCDYRYIAAGRKLMGLNEVKLGLPVPYPGDHILRHLIGTRDAQEMTYTGDFYGPKKLIRMGVVDRVLPLDQVVPKAIEKARELGQLPSEAFRRIKKNRTDTIKADILAHLPQKEQDFINCWRSDTAHQLLKEATTKF